MKTRLVLAAVLGWAGLACAQSGESFTSATIKTAAPDGGKEILPRGKSFSATRVSLAELIAFAYDVHPTQVTGGPAWLRTNMYDVSAAAPASLGIHRATDAERVMLQKLLAERFQLALHKDMRELPVYTLNFAKSGGKLQVAESVNPGPSIFFRGMGKLPVKYATLGEFAEALQATVVDRPVVNQTDVKGRWNFDLTWTPDATQFVSMGGYKAPAVKDPKAPPDLMTAMDQQLGLELKPGTARVEVLVIDKAETPK